MADQRSVTVWAAAALRSCLSLAKTCSIGRQVEEAGASRFDRLAHAVNLVGAEIVDNDDVVLAQGRRQHLFDVGAKDPAVHRAIDDEGGGDPVAAQRRNEGRGFPMAVRHRSLQPLTARASAAGPRHVGGGPRLVDEHQLAGVQARLPRRQASRAAATSGRSCSAAWRAFF